MKCVYELPYYKHKLLFDTWIAHSSSLLIEQLASTLMLVDFQVRYIGNRKNLNENDKKCVNNEVFTLTCLTACISYSLHLILKCFRCSRRFVAQEIWPMIFATINHISATLCVDFMCRVTVLQKDDSSTDKI